MPVELFQPDTDIHSCTYCNRHRTVQCTLCKDYICTAHRVKVQGYDLMGPVDMCQSCAKYIDTIVVPKYPQ